MESAQIHDIPPELWDYVFQNMPHPSLLSLRRVSRSFRDYVDMWLDKQKRNAVKGCFFAQILSNRYAEHWISTDWFTLFIHMRTSLNREIQRNVSNFHRSNASSSGEILRCADMYITEAAGPRLGELVYKEALTSILLQIFTSEKYYRPEYDDSIKWCIRENASSLAAVMRDSLNQIDWNHCKGYFPILFKLIVRENDRQFEETDIDELHSSVSRQPFIEEKKFCEVSNRVGLNGFRIRNTPIIQTLWNEKLIPTMLTRSNAESLVQRAHTISPTQITEIIRGYVSHNSQTDPTQEKERLAQLIQSRIVVVRFSDSRPGVLAYCWVDCQQPGRPLVHAMESVARPTYNIFG